MANWMPPNVLLMHSHDLGRHLGCDGVPMLRTPHLETLAASGVRFADAFCTAPQCSPWRAALFTGCCPHSTGVMGLGSHYEQRAELVADRTEAAMMDRVAHASRPFYLQVGFLEPHRIETPDYGDVVGFTGGYLPLDDSLGVTVPGYLADDPGTREEVAELQGAIHYVDTQVGRVLDVLDATGRADDTIVIFTTDHGLALPRAKWPLLRPGPGDVSDRPRARPRVERRTDVSGLVSNVDLVPTMLDAAAIRAPDALHGRSLTAALAGREWRARGIVFGELTYHAYDDPMRGVRTDEYKLIVHFDNAMPHIGPATQSWRPRSSTATPQRRRAAGMVELYDLRADPLETVNLATDPDHRDAVETLRQELLEWMRTTGDPLRDGAIASPTQAEAQAFITIGLMP